MIDEILQIYNQAPPTIPPVTTYVCKYCSKGFRREQTLVAHLCTPKRRWMQEKETGVQLGLHAYLRFYEITQGSAKLKGYKDFVDSDYYSAFVKFGRHMVAIRAVNTKSFIDYVINQNKKLDQWCHEAIYLEYLHQYIRKEAVQDAVERALLEMQAYADEHPQLKNGFTDYFKYGNTNKICFDITNGRISPWVLYNCVSGVDFLETLSEEQVGLIISCIAPDFWQRKFKDYVADTLWATEVLKEAGL